MGTFRHAITLVSATGDRRETLEALVDTRATFTSVPATMLETLGVVPQGSVRLQLANGQIEERRIGPVNASVNGVERIILCVFGEPGEPPVIGAHTLEAFLLSVDPVRRRLTPVVGFRLRRNAP